MKSRYPKRGVGHEPLDKPIYDQPQPCLHTIWAQGSDHAELDDCPLSAGSLVARGGASIAQCHKCSDKHRVPPLDVSRSNSNTLLPSFSLRYIDLNGRSQGILYDLMNLMVNV